MTAQLVTHVIDDEDAVREPLVMLAQAAGHLAEGHASAEGFLRDADLDSAGCVVTDVLMPGMSGLELLRALAARAPGLPVIVITGHGEVAMAVEALKAGAVDFIEKPFNGAAFQAAVAAALVRRAKVNAERSDLAALRARARALTAREREVMDLVTEGHSNAVVAERLRISVRTVENHRAKVLTKMGVRSLPQLVRIALRLAQV